MRKKPFSSIALTQSVTGLVEEAPSVHAVPHRLPQSARFRLAERLLGEGLKVLERRLEGAPRVSDPIEDGAQFCVRVRR